LRTFRLKKQEKLSIKFVHRLNQGEQRKVDIYFALPKEMGINKKTLSESEYFNSGIKGRRAYFTNGLHLPLLHTRFASRMKRSPEEYKTNLNLFAYQYLVALETDSHSTLAIKDDGNLSDFYQAAEEITAHCTTILKKHRSHRLNDREFQSIFENVDNYLSWYTEQTLLRMLAKKPRTTEFAENRQAILKICEEENNYRTEKGYNSAATISDPNRIANKMRLLRRLIEFGVIFKSETIELGNITRKIAAGVATSIIMSFVLILILKTQGAFNNITALMILLLAIIYGVREVFKDDFKTILWQWIRKGKPKWARTLKDAVSHNEIARQKVWLDYIKKAQLPAHTKTLLDKRHSQNKQSTEYLHFCIETKVNKQGFQPGYESIEESILFNLQPFARYLERGNDKVYEQNPPSANKEKIQGISIARRYQINMFIMLGQNTDNPVCERYKITLEPTGIIELEKLDSTKANEQNKQLDRYSRLRSLLHFK
jgi:hypothetical protein